MSDLQSYFLCGIGGSGMLPLAMILQAQGHRVEGSDRALDQGRNAPKFDYLRNRGIVLHAQDGSGISSASQILVASTAVEETVPDIVAARKVGCRCTSRAEMLASLFNGSARPIGVAGTSGKSTVTGMIAWILHAAGQEPTVMNGAVMNNFTGADEPFASALVGCGGDFVSEVDESDGSIEYYNPTVAILTNISEDHKSMDELRTLFQDFLGRADQAVLNADNLETLQIRQGAAPEGHTWFSLVDDAADLYASNLAPAADGIAFTLQAKTGATVIPVELQVPGVHNVANALAAIGAAITCNISIEDATHFLGGFTGLHRRLEMVGTAYGVTVIDDFGHNPDKIAATLKTLHAFPGRLLVMFQPHGYGPLRNMRRGFVETFSTQLRSEDVLLMPEPVYYGGTTVKDISSRDITTALVANGIHAEAYNARADCGVRLISLAKPGDRIVIMGARDDTLADFARDLLYRIGP
ncbi:MAG: Mur ligase family protein [Rhodospirillaceae bacterium]|nr:Mur ligase family protein [Rhodospirillaceae bacterium]MCY4311734.1 Mur ligase family protein [Rhodospirillaceae bacterium]